MRAILLLSLLLLPACATVTRHGDALLVEPGKVQLAPSIGSLEFPRVAIGQPDHYHFAVRDLPRPIYPEDLSIIASQREQLLPSAQQPWFGASLSVRLVAPDGTVFLRQVLAFESGRDGAFAARTDGTAPSFLFLRSFREGWNAAKGPKYLSYDVYIDVVVPSRRPIDEVRVHASTL